MWHLGSWVTAEVTDAEGAVVGLIGKFSRGNPPRRLGAGSPVVPVLAEEAVGRAAGIEDGQVVAAHMTAALAHPVGDAVGGQRIAIPVQQASGRRAREVDQTALTNGAQPAETALSLPDGACIGAQRTAAPAWRARRLLGETECRAGSGMHQSQPMFNCGRRFCHASAAEPEGRRQTHRCAPAGATAGNPISPHDSLASRPRLRPNVQHTTSGTSRVAELKTAGACGSHT